MLYREIIAVCFEIHRVTKIHCVDRKFNFKMSNLAVHKQALDLQPTTICIISLRSVAFILNIFRNGEYCTISNAYV